MDENITLAIVGIGMGFFGAAVWYAEMFTDSKAANLWRRMNGNGRISRNYAAIGAPACACIFLLGGTLGIANYFQLPGIWTRIAAILIFLPHRPSAHQVSQVGLRRLAVRQAPWALRRRWQHRSGGLREPCGQEGILVNEPVTMTLSSGWR